MQEMLVRNILQTAMGKRKRQITHHRQRLYYCYNQQHHRQPRTPAWLCLLESTPVYDSVEQQQQQQQQ
jgi:hypothetical protein